MLSLVVSSAAAFHAETMFFKQPYHTSALLGDRWVKELLAGNPRHVKDQLGMSKHVFRKLVRNCII